MAAFFRTIESPGRMLSTIQISESQILSDQNHGDPAGMAGFSGNDGLTADAVRRKTVGTDSGFGTGGGRLYPYGIGRGRPWYEFAGWHLPH